MNNWQSREIIHRQDGSYVIEYKGYPYHVPNMGEWTALFAEVDAWAKAHPEQVSAELPPPGPTLEEARTAKLADFDTVMAENDRKLIRPLANGEAEIVERINAAQAQNRELRARVAAAETLEELAGIEPVSVDLSAPMTE